VWILVSLNRSAYATRQTIIRAQPVPFSHDHHTEVMGIAITKAILVILYFIHVRHSSRLTKVVVVAGFLWLHFLIGFTMSDYLTRGMISMQGTIG